MLYDCFLNKNVKILAVHSLYMQLMRYRWPARSTFVYICHVPERGEKSLGRRDGAAFSSMKGSGVSRKSEEIGRWGREREITRF